MESYLPCNVRKCHKNLSECAWVTSCSHIFCEDCVKSAFVKGNTCPACSGELSTKYDIVRIDLQPTEQYKSMILAGLRPEIIMEISTRALSFWTYQVFQEKIHLDANVKALKENVRLMEQHYVQLSNGSQEEFNRLRRQLTASKQSEETMQQQMNDISDKLSEKSRQHQKLQSLYEALRRKCIAAQLNPTEEHEQEHTASRGPVTGFEFAKPKSYNPLSTRNARGSSPYAVRVGTPLACSPRDQGVRRGAGWDASPRDQGAMRARSRERNQAAAAAVDPEFSFGQFALFPEEDQSPVTTQSNAFLRLF